MPDPTDRLNTDDASAYIRERHGRRCSSAYLMKLRCLGKGPSFYRFNGQVVYEQSDLDNWAQNSGMRGPFKKASQARRNRTLDCVTSQTAEVA